MAAHFFNDESVCQLPGRINKGKKILDNDTTIDNVNALKSKGNKGDRREWDTLSVITHNINGIKNNKNKLFNLINWAREKDIKAIGISDTNIDKKEGQWLNKKEIIDMGYIGYWSNKDNKVKGSGVAILIKNTWSKHVGSVVNRNPYFIEITLFFKGINIKLTQVYAPPNDISITRKLTDLIKERHIHKDRYRSLIIGDFNTVIDPNLDKRGGKRIGVVKPNRIINALNKYNYIDTYRELNPSLLKYTWDNRRIGPDNIKTRIDYIWSDINWSHDILGCDIKNAELITDSDHNIVKACYNTSNIIRNQKVSQRNKGKKETRRIFKYDDIKKEAWDKYKKIMDDLIDKDERDSQVSIIVNLERGINQDHIDRSLLDQTWKNILEIFNTTIERSIPYEEKSTRKIQTDDLKKLERRSYKFYTQLKDIKRLRRLLTFGKRHINKPISIEFIVEYNIFIAKLNAKYNTSIKYINTHWSSEWIELGVKELKNINTKLRNNMELDKQQHIEDAVNK